ncbi:MAG: hypothetical protein R6V77_00035 [Candidatus Cloacimonadaceae bacterium]
MPDLNKETDVRLEALSMFKVLDGLIHNINTPLNVIIGYSQQLKKQYPEIAYLESITDAGIQIDDLVQACSRQYITRMQSEIRKFELGPWLEDEIKLLKNILEVKHSLRFELNQPEQKISVKSNQMLLGLFIDALVLQAKAENSNSNGDNIVRFSIANSGDFAVLSILLPENEQITQGLSSFLTGLESSLEQMFEVSAKEANLFTWSLPEAHEVKILLPIAGEA